MLVSAMHCYSSPGNGGRSTLLISTPLEMFPCWSHRTWLASNQDCPGLSQSRDLLCWEVLPELAESMPKKSHQMQVSPVQNTLIPEKGTWDYYTLMREVRDTRTERKPVGNWEFVNTTDTVLPARTDCSHSYLQGENWSQAWFYFQQKQQVINLYLIIETNGLTPSLAEHNAGKKLEILIKTRDFSTWPLTSLRPSKFSAKATGSFILDKIMLEISHVHL